MSVVATAVDPRLKSILIATDFSQASEKPLCHALAIARCYGAKVYLAHVVSSLGFTLAGPAAIAAAEEAVCRDAAHLEDDLVRSGALSGLQHQVVIRQGEVWPELEAIIRQEEIDSIVIGTHGRHGMGRLLLGSVAELIFRQADCLVLTVGPGAYAQPRIEIPRANRTFLLATDFGDASIHALPYAISFANHRFSHAPDHGIRSGLPCGMSCINGQKVSLSDRKDARVNSEHVLFVEGFCDDSV
jgi:nucleotide-binding universal stress UspA family protein